MCGMPSSLSLIPGDGVAQRVLAERVRPVFVDASRQRHEQRVHFELDLVRPGGQAA